MEKVSREKLQLDMMRQQQKIEELERLVKGGLSLAASPLPSRTVGLVCLLFLPSHSLNH